MATMATGIATNGDDGLLTFGPADGQWLEEQAADTKPAKPSMSPWNALTGWVGDGDLSSPIPKEALGVPQSAILTWFEMADFGHLVDVIYNNKWLWNINKEAVLKDLKMIAVAHYKDHTYRPLWDKPPAKVDYGGLFPWLKAQERDIVFERARKAGLGGRLDELLAPSAGEKIKRKN